MSNMHIIAGVRMQVCKKKEKKNLGWKKKNLRRYKEKKGGRYWIAKDRVTVSILYMCVSSGQYARCIDADIWIRGYVDTLIRGYVDNIIVIVIIIYVLFSFYIVLCH